MKYVLLIAILVFTQLTQGKPMEEKILYKIDNQPYEGVLVRSQNSSSKKQPGLLMISNWMGVSPESIKQAHRFANLGYIVFIADIYGKNKNPQNTQEAAKLATFYKKDRSLYRVHLNKSLEELKKISGVDQNKIAAMGYCFGGTGVLELARSGADIKGVISFHGGLDSPSPKDGQNIKAKILVLHGAIDPFISKNDFDSFQKELNDARVDYQIISYANTVHSFTDSGAGSDISTGSAYSKVADERSFLATKNFLEEIFK